VQIAENIGRFTPDLEIALYRLVQDCLANTVRHAKAKRFELALHRTDEGLHLEIMDDGVGIGDLRKAKGRSHGLANMIHRVRSVHGTFDLESRPGAGTRIVVFVPVR
jgi:signal transduction histidine kinase